MRVHTLICMEKDGDDEDEGDDDVIVVVSNESLAMWVN